MNATHSDMTGWPKATVKRRLLALFVDFICFNAFWGLAVWALSKLIPSIQNADGPIKFGIFLLFDLILLGLIKWSPGNDLLGIHIRIMPAHLKARQQSYLSSDLAVNPYLKSRERWWTILFGVIVLLDGLKGLVRWTTFETPMPFFGYQTSTMEAIGIALALGVTECFVGIAVLRLHRYVLPLGIGVFAATAASMFLSWSMIPAWIEASTYARRNFQGMNVRPGEIEFMQSAAPLLIIWPIVQLIWTVFVYLKIRNSLPTEQGALKLKSSAKTAGWRRYDPSWLVEASRKQCPDKPWLAEALSNCTLGRYESDAYIYFADASKPNQPSSQWQFKENIILEATPEGDIVLDVLKDGKIGGAEFLSKIL